MTVAEMIKWLKTQDQNAVVNVVYHTDCSGYYDQGGTATTVAFVPAKHSTYDEQRVYSFSGNVKTYPAELLLGVFEG